MFLKPKGGRQVPSPDHGGKDLPAEGAEVESSVYWQRRLDDGDVEIVPPANSKAKGDSQ